MPDHGQSPPESLTPAERAAAAAGTIVYEGEAEAARQPRPVSKWALHRRLYDWVIGFAHHKHSTAALAGLSFAESSFFPIPPDVLLMPLALGHNRKAWWFATVCTLASVTGGVLGWLIGYYAWEATKGFWFDVVPGFNEAKFDQVVGLYNEWGILILFAAALTPIPYKVFTIAGGVLHQNLLLFVIVSFIGRGLRFYAVAGAMWLFGDRIVPFIDRYFNLLSIVFVLLLVGGFAAIKLLH
jgi:membrane protein YqaA with SNARE-associated domain